MVGIRVRSLAPLAGLAMLATAAAAQVTAPRVENVPIPSNVDPFSLSLEDFKKYSSARNFELLGQTYFKVPERTPLGESAGSAGPRDRLRLQHRAGL